MNPKYYGGAPLFFETPARSRASGRAPGEKPKEVFLVRLGAGRDREVGVFNVGALAIRTKCWDTF